MISYGAGPQPDEVEITVFGPGFGEAIAVHLGEERWMLIDSCIDPNSKKPAGETYLSAIGVSPDRVKSLVASHWHDDHVRGLARLAEIYQAAELNIASTFNDAEARAFLAAYGGHAAAAKLSRGTTELFQALRGRERSFYIHHRANVFEQLLPNSGRRVRAVALSPMQAAFAAAVARMASFVPRVMDQPIDHVPELPPNLEAVVIHIDWGDDAVLLGSDLEDHRQFGWTAVLADFWSSSRQPSSAYKVAHHGSKSGDNPEIWTRLLKEQPVACLTPFNLGSQRLPGEIDKARILGRTPHAYISSAASNKPAMASDRLRRLSQMCTELRPRNPGFGAVRLRKPFGGATWGVELFGSARELRGA